MKTKAKTKIILVLAVFALLMALFAALFFGGILKLNTPSAEQYPVRGVDVSEYQGAIDWEVMEKQGVQFAFVKATEGSGYTDPFFESNWSGVGDTSILYGAYHFYSFDSPALSQGENFIRTVDKTAGMLPPVVDIELYGRHRITQPDPIHVRAELDALLHQLEDYYGAKPIIYTTRQVNAKYISGHYLEYPLWIRDVYLVPQLLAGQQWTFWQYSDKGRLDGYDGQEQYIDLNVFAAGADDLAGLCLP